MKTSTRCPIVLVDDSNEDVFIFTRLLRKSGLSNPFQPMLAAEAFIGWLTALIAPESKADRPLVCFLDVKMPGMDGFGVLRWIRQQSTLDAMPVVMLSSSDDPRDTTRAAMLGAQCYLLKHPSPTVLTEVMQDARLYADATKPSRSYFEHDYNLLLPRRDLCGGGVVSNRD